MKSKLYTRTGDDGTTSLVGGQRVAKTSVRLEAYGTLDEFSSLLGVVLSHHDCPQEIRGQLTQVQSMLFEIGAYLASAPADADKMAVKDLADDTARLEGWIDALDEQTPPMKSFVLPGGCELSAHTHVARAVCRRAERRILALNALEPVDPGVMEYVNRLSDYLFIMARYFNFLLGVAEIAWQKRK